MGLFHGPETLRLEHTKDAIVYNGDVSWKKEVEFDIKVEDIPRDCRLCFALYIKKNKVNHEADWQIFCRGLYSKTTPDIDAFV